MIGMRKTGKNNPIETRMKIRATMIAMMPGGIRTSVTSSGTSQSVRNGQIPDLQRGHQRDSVHSLHNQRGQRRDNVRSLHNLRGQRRDNVRSLHNLRGQQRDNVHSLHNQRGRLALTPEPGRCARKH